jgi:ADP-ribose pyrophosphatase
MTESGYRTLSSNRIFTGRVISLRSDEVSMPDGSVATRDVVEHPGAVAIVALDDQNRVVLVEQYRQPIGHTLVELPAGLLDVEGESALTGAQRELFEEAALRASSWRVLVDLHTSPGMTDEAIRIFLARGLSDVPAEDRFAPEHEEVGMTVSRLSLDAAIERVLAGELTNAAACAGILAAGAARAGHGFDALRAADSSWAARPGR